MATRVVRSNWIVPEVLRKDNYEEWSDCVRDYLMAEDLWGVVGEPIKLEDFETLGKKNAAALHAIKISCSPSILKTLQDSDRRMANSLWNALKNKLRNPPQPRATNSGADADHTRFAGLVKAINKGDLDGVKDFLSLNRDAKKNIISYPGMKAIHLAALAGHGKIVEELIKGMAKKDLEEKNSIDNTVLCIAAQNGMTEIAEILMKNHSDLITIPGSENFLPVSIACNRGHKEATHYLYSKTAEHLKDFGDNEIAEQSEVLLPEWAGDQRLGSGPAITKLHHELGVLSDIKKKELEVLKDNMIILLNVAISNNMFDIALDLLKNNEGAALRTKRSASSRPSALTNLSGMPFAFFSGTRFSIWQRLIYHCIRVQPPDSSTAREYDPQMYKEPRQPMAGIMRFLEFIGIKQIYEMKLIHVRARKVLDYIFKEPTPPLDAEQREEITNSLFKAVKNGITEVVVQIIQAYPDMLWKTTKIDQKDIFHYAISMRQEKVFSLVYGLDARRVPLITRYDKHHNSMLHMAGCLAPPTRLDHISGEALQMQRELQWFEEVESIMTPTTKQKKNLDGDTPKQVFTKNHKDLVTKGEKWMKKYASSCTIVGTLIITMMFAAAFNVPGGTNKDTGLPFFRHKTSFMVYIVSDAVALFTSSTSVFTFIGILTSRYSEENFLKSLPRKLMFGLFTLFCSVTAMMITFCAGLIIMVEGELSVIIPIISLAGFTVTVFVFLQFPLLFEILKNTCGSIFNRKTKPWLCQS
ncbi:hypothetical protein HS088_TW09G00661 [Tripterygium wilfordii]|uniref:PGG domain-containing protein n=1 Tax=Tripterygium wilfordii TaxID=458696 RepID=A0A7J7D8B9_TRIWF|nr:uncharacterized protein LOC120006149 isoform X2 [Tripterygium wilfordii]KAF5742610.1 hypothetical protein HS088_TW09G00661 [Tripterygium wilfordii]